MADLSPENVEENSDVSESDLLCQVEGMIRNMRALDALTEEEKEEAIEEMRRGKKFGFMACGVTGVGKSTLLNGIAGEYVFKEGDRLQHETIEIKKHTMKRHNSSLTLCDTPGFCDSSGDEEKYIAKIRDACSEDVDMLLYCISMQNPKAQLHNDVKTLQKLRKALKDEIWSHCIVVLTFANSEVTRLEQRLCTKLEDTFAAKFKEWKDKVRKLLIDAGIDPENIPVILAGVKTKPSLLPRSADIWLSILWHTVYDKATSDGQFVLTLVNAGRIKARSEVDENDRKTKELYEQPIVPNKTWKDTLKAKFPIIAAALGAGGAAGATGATIGAVIGALAIGIPSFGIAAGLGLVLGAAVGGGAGIGVGVMAAKTVETIKRKKEAKAKVEMADEPREIESTL